MSIAIVSSHTDKTQQKTEEELGWERRLPEADGRIDELRLKKSGISNETTTKFGEYMKFKTGSIWYP